MQNFEDDTDARAAYLICLSDQDVAAAARSEADAMRAGGWTIDRLVKVAELFDWGDLTVGDLVNAARWADEAGPRRRADLWQVLYG